jgi:hypothetical protein
MAICLIAQDILVPTDNENKLTTIVIAYWKCEE